MDSPRFDALIRALHQRVGSRRALPAFLAGLGAPLVATAANARTGGQAAADADQAGRRRRRKPDLDPGLRLFERLAEELKGITGDCAALTQAAEAFRLENQAQFDDLVTSTQQMDAGTRTRLARKHKGRITRATEALHTLMTSCRFRGAATAQMCGPVGGDPVPRPGEAQCTGCDCSCVCPISTGDCTFSFFGCLGGSHASCCWFGACAGHMCLEQCPNCCNCGPDCCGC